MPKERRFSTPLGPDFSDGDGEEGSDDVAAGFSGVRGVEGWWLARGEAKGSAPRVAAEKIKAKIGYNNDDPPILQPAGGEGTSAVAKAATDTQTVVKSPAKKGEEEKDGSALKHLKAQLPLQLFATVLT
ncbi:hypothetical protein ERO13_A09G238450v2 [Gossypium hirsutum]|uniref:Uncharacterized protein n=1 Tax=Gossypium hirsutum TaxID=3635 RepID=A0A1U8M8P5_GOSHI|nr:uncharacterized protein LOC107935164 [Gossypium hirsutum]KAG4185548.1 hypothetical protein ERO13_A09G238450v2 [Gossypium hirsutum]